MKRTKYWCLGCGVYTPEPCDIVGHISRKLTYDEGGRRTEGETTIAANYLGKLEHLKVKLPG